MKKIICLVLILIMLVSLFACEKTDGDDIENEGSSDAVSADSDTAGSDGTEKVIEYDGIFKAGYSIVDITPTEPIHLNTGDLLDKVQEPIYATCIAVNDGKNTVLLFSLDIKNISETQDAELRDYINLFTKVPAKNIIFHATHNHSAPTPGVPSTSSSVYRWTQTFRKKVLEAAKEAIADLSDAQIYTGVAKTTNLAFVRRYIHADGSFSGIHVKNVSSTPIVRHETEADDTAQIIRFVREDKKDILIANWQAHAAHAIGQVKNSVSGDYVYYFRQKIERKNDDLAVALFCGASGNINLTVKIQSRNICSADYRKTGLRLGEAVYDQLENLRKIQPGKIEVLTKSLIVPYREVTDDQVERAKKVVASGEEGSAEYNAALLKYGLNSKYEVNKLIWLSNNQGKNGKITLRTIVFGDLAFAAVPYEMFDTNGMEVKEGSPYDVTFILATSNGSLGYIPSAIAVKNGGYEVYTSIFRYGTAEEVVAELLGLLEKLKK